MLLRARSSARISTRTTWDRRCVLATPWPPVCALARAQCGDWGARCAQLYASSWFITMYANRLDPEVCLFLWDTLLLEKDADSQLIYFVSLALLLSRRCGGWAQPCE
jgi:hypothetical protein